MIILGGTGFIGSAIAQACAESDVQCVALGSGDCDLTDASQCMAELPAIVAGETVVYAAGIPRSRSDSIDAMQANMEMVINLASALREAPPARVVFLSSVEVYGVPSALPVDEQTEIRPFTMYAVAKYACEQVLRIWHRETGVPLAMLRMPGIYGPGDGGHSIVGKLVQCARDSQPFRLVNGGTWKRDYVCVDDIAGVVSALMTKEFEELTLNIATGHSMTIRQVIDHVTDLYGPVTLDNVQEESYDGHLEFDVSRMRELLPKVEMTELGAGLKTYGDR